MTDRDAKLSLCGCCQGLEPLTPASLRNRPGLSALAYRVGTHGQFKETMLAALSRHPALRSLTTRDDDDPAIALLDAWATALDVLTFYQERIANEGYLRTATERLSVLELARSIGYELRPGLAASTYLAFWLEDAPGAPSKAKIPVGTQAQSLPGQDEKPQLFETGEEIEVRTAWQDMKPKMKEAFVPHLNTTTIYLEGTTTNLRKGDGLLLVGSERKADPKSDRWDFRRVKSVSLNAEADITTVVLDRGLGSPRKRPAEDPQVYALRGRAALFGHNAPVWKTMPKSVKAGQWEIEESKLDPKIHKDWKGFTLSKIAAPDEETIHLDAVYEKIVPDSWVVLWTSQYAELYEVDKVAEDARADFTLSAKTTRLQLKGENLKDKFDHKVREAVVFAESELLKRADKPVTTNVSGNTVEVCKKVEGLKEGQLVMVRGTDQETGEAASEVVAIYRAEPNEVTTRLTFSTNLKHVYLRDDTLEFNANVAPATHGETEKDEVLGSGEGSKAFQKFELSKKPLTFVSAPTASGGKTTLAVRVAGVLWHEAPSLHSLPADRRAYITRLADDGSVTVQFGDGIQGARLPTGSENVTATYRVGLGLEGLVKAGQISLLKTPPLGVKRVENPTAPTGADEAEKLANARANAPSTVLTLDRIVSVRDFEDFAQAFSGIGKAQAALLWSGERQLVHLTIAGVQGKEVPASSATYKDLKKAIDAARHTDQPMRIDPYDPKDPPPFTLQARIRVDQGRLAEDVLQEVREALREAFSFDKRAFGQSVTASEAVAVMQAVAGVIYVDLEKLDGRDPLQRPRLAAATVRRIGDDIQPAQLLVIDPNNIELIEIAS